MQLSPENQRWLEAFRARHGRAPRILHIGNIANNAYNNAKILNEVGLDCDVICYDYYHIMVARSGKMRISQGRSKTIFDLTGQRSTWVDMCAHGGLRRARWACALGI